MPNDDFQDVFYPLLGDKPLLKRRKKFYSRASRPFGSGMSARQPDPETVSRFLRLVASGVPMPVVYQTYRMPSECVWRRWVHENPEIMEAYQAAKRARVLKLRHEVMELADGPDAAEAAERIDARKHLHGALSKGLRQAAQAVTADGEDI
ncbi:hypothetical protein [Rhodoblastus sp.]|uniref:terminase small subunit-like protein n=1 Tax=Rhodoblastus sp. TaxID=1962975 RepID=UPI002613A880|nr:hypothetical protein [Rhodoblastus sp.]